MQYPSLQRIEIQEKLNSSLVFIFNGEKTKVNVLKIKTDRFLSASFYFIALYKITSKDYQ